MRVFFSFGKSDFVLVQPKAKIIDSSGLNFSLKIYCLAIGDRPTVIKAVPATVRNVNVFCINKEVVVYNLLVFDSTNLTILCVHSGVVGCSLGLKIVNFGMIGRCIGL